MLTYSAYTKPTSNRRFDRTITGVSIVDSILELQKFDPLRLSPNARTVLGKHNTARFLELKALKDGWDFGRGKALNSDSLRTIELFLRSYNSFPERCSLFLSARGNLELAWDAGDDMVNSLEFYPEHIAYYIEATDDEGEVSLTNIHALVQKLLSAKKNV